jgi:hypothetical protein
MTFDVFQHCDPPVVAQWMREALREGGRSKLSTVIDRAIKAFGQETTKRALLLLFREDDFSTPRAR